MKSMLKLPQTSLVMSYCLIELPMLPCFTWSCNAFLFRYWKIQLRIAWRRVVVCFQILKKWMGKARKGRTKKIRWLYCCFLAYTKLASRYAYILYWKIYVISYRKDLLMEESKVLLRKNPRRIKLGVLEEKLHARNPTLLLQHQESNQSFLYQSCMPLISVFFFATD